MGYVVDETDPTLEPRLTNLENNVYKVTYYEIITGASGAITPPAGASINSGEFGLSGNAVLSKVDGSNKPTFQTPTDSGGNAVTASLNVTTGAWVASGSYTDLTVALIYSVNIAAVDFSNLDNFYIVESVKLEYDLNSTAFGSFINNLSSKTTPVDADQVPLMDSGDSNKTKKLSWANLKATLKTFFDGLYVSLTGAYVNPTWIVSLAWSKITGTPTTMQGYGITNGTTLIAKSVADSAPQSGVTILILNSLLIPAGSITTGDIVDFFNMINKAGDLGTMNHRMYLNTSPVLAGATAIALGNANATSDSSCLGRTAFVKSATNTTIQNAGTATFTRDGVNAGPVSVLNIDWTVDQYLLSSAQPSNAGDVLKDQGMYVSKR